MFDFRSPLVPTRALPTSGVRSVHTQFYIRCKSVLIWVYLSIYMQYVIQRWLFAAKTVYFYLEFFDASPLTHSSASVEVLWGSSSGVGSDLKLDLHFRLLFAII